MGDHFVAFNPQPYCFYCRNAPVYEMQEVTLLDYIEENSVEVYFAANVCNDATCQQRLAGRRDRDELFIATHRERDQYGDDPTYDDYEFFRSLRDEAADDEIEYTRLHNHYECAQQFLQREKKKMAKLERKLDNLEKKITRKQNLILNYEMLVRDYYPATLAGAKKSVEEEDEEYIPEE